MSPPARTGVDYVGFNDADRAAPASTRGAAGAITATATPRHLQRHVNGTAGTPTPITGPNTFTVEAWFKTTTTTGGKIIGFGNRRPGRSSSYDRHVYMDNAGQHHLRRLPRRRPDGDAARRPTTTASGTTWSATLGPAA